jgi:hypothetical protein
MDAPDLRRAATIGFLVTEYERWTGRQWQPRDIESWSRASASGSDRMTNRKLAT